MAERPEDLNLPNAVITRIIKEAVSTAHRKHRTTLHCSHRKHRTTLRGQIYISYFLLCPAEVVLPS